MSKGRIPDEKPRNLQEQLLLEDAKSGNGIPIQGGIVEPLKDASRLVAHYGGKPEDWVKMSGKTTKIINGMIVQIHWFKNIQNNQTVEFKFKRTYPKTAPKNQ
ncbi:MAG: hypothetical protein QNJ33_10335 [Crocosphaera sp.]|nr:hypothetical protein [Crocosphaera sp.]